MGNDRERLFADYRSGYASHADFCMAFSENTKVLYLLAFLLTANHQDAERCFFSAVDQAFKANTVFKGFVTNWIRRTLIIKAAKTVFEVEHRDKPTPDPWFAGQDGIEAAVDSITSQPSLERFIFVMLFLERYSVRECSLLLGVSAGVILECRERALANLAIGGLSLIGYDIPVHNR